MIVKYDVLLRNCVFFCAGGSALVAYVCMTRARARVSLGVQSMAQSCALTHTHTYAHTHIAQIVERRTSVFPFVVYLSFFPNWHHIRTR